MTTANEIWGPERLKRINGDPALLSLLYDLNLLPEVVLAHIRAAREDERKKLAEWAREKVRGHRKIVIEKQDAGDHEMASTHLAIETAYVGIVKELEESREGESEK